MTKLLFILLFLTLGCEVPIVVGIASYYNTKKINIIDSRVEEEITQNKINTTGTLEAVKSIEENNLATPDLINFSLSKAKKIIDSQQLEIGEITYIYLPALIPGTVIGQSLSVSEKAGNSVTIDLEVSTDLEIRNND